MHLNVRLQVWWPWNSLPLLLCPLWRGVVVRVPSMGHINLLKIMSIERKTFCYSYVTFIINLRCFLIFPLMSSDTSIECTLDDHQGCTILIANFGFLYIRLAQVATPTRIQNSWSPPSKLRATCLNENPPPKKKPSKNPKRLYGEIPASISQWEISTAIFFGWITNLDSSSLLLSRGLYSRYVLLHFVRKILLSFHSLLFAIDFYFLFSTKITFVPKTILLTYTPFSHTYSIH